MLKRNSSTIKDYQQATDMFQKQLLIRGYPFKTVALARNKADAKTEESFLLKK